MTPVEYISDSNLKDKTKAVNDEVEDTFNVQYEHIDPMELETCCCPEKTNYSKLSLRLEKKEIPPCDCECPDSNHEGQIRKILEGFENQKLKISVRL